MCTLSDFYEVILSRQGDHGGLYLWGMSRFQEQPGTYQLTDTRILQLLRALS